MTIPVDTKEFAINMSNMFWEQPVRRYVTKWWQVKPVYVARF